MSADTRSAPAPHDTPLPASSRRGLSLALVTAIVSGIAVYVNGQAVRRFPSPTVYTTGKNLLAGVLLLALVAATTRRRAPGATRRLRDLAPRQVGLVVGVAALGGGVAFVLFFEGLARATSGDAAFLHKTMVVWAALIAMAVLRERVGAVQVAAIALLVLGHVVLADGVGSLRPGAGEVMILGATLLWSVEVVAVRWLLTSADSVPLDPGSLGAIRIGGGALLLVAWVAVSGDLGALVDLTPAQLGWLAVTGVLLAGFVSCWYRALAVATVVDVTAVLVLGAVITGWLDVVVGHAPVGLRLPGWVLIAVGVALVVGHQLVTGPDRQRTTRLAG